ncbi:MAG: SAM-dependent methyltransferase [Clostridia bacterium]|nr:SAM-dependent methyltransferase [Clostridia bacterium]
MHIWQANNAGGARSASLSARLSAIAESLPRGGVVCDVGSDHGALPLFLLENGWCRHAIVTDLNPEPLARAKAALTSAGIAHKAQFFLTDGILDVISLSPDTFVIAGMGGETIAGILSRALDRIPLNTGFVLQPMSRAHLLRKFLYENGFSVEGEQAIGENGKVFLIFRARFDGVRRERDPEFYLVGEYLSQTKGEGASLYFEKRLAKVRSKIVGKEKAGFDVSLEKKEEALYLSQLEAINENS